MLAKLTKALLTMTLLTGSLYIQAQTLNPVVLASTGGYGSGSWGSLSYTGGEAVIQTGVSPVVTLTQGFHQPLITSGVGISTPSLDDVFTFYPNPARKYIDIVSSLKKGEICVYNDIGQLIWKSDMIPERLSVSHFSTGLYQIVVFSDKKVMSKKLIVY
jgi:Secretion system C-terminal sorting domain